MNTAIESAFLAALTTLVPIATIEHHTGVSGDENEPENAAIIVHCEECEHTVGPLWKATVVFRLETPAYDNQRTEHNARLVAIRAWLDNKAAVAAALQPGGLRLSGYFVRKSQTSIEHKRWVAEIEIVAGVDNGC